MRQGIAGEPGEDRLSRLDSGQGQVHVVWDLADGQCCAGGLPSGGVLRRLKSGPVRPLFRALALVLGPLLLGAGVLLVILDLRGVNAHGWPAWTRRIHIALWLGLGNLALGWRLLRAARTGVDPYDVADEDETPE
jgi:hypothetical protein